MKFVGVGKKQFGLGLAMKKCFQFDYLAIMSEQKMEASETRKNRKILGQVL